MKLFTLKTFTVFAIILLFASGAYAAKDQVGTMRVVINNVKITSEKGKEREAKKNDPVYVNDTVRTGKNSKAKILFNNENILILGFESEVKINELVYKEESQESQSIFSLAKGKVRAIVKKLFTKSSQFRIKTANSDIGVLGTDFIVVYNDLEKILEAFVQSGKIEIQSPDNRWTPLNLLDNFYTKIKGEDAPADPKPFDNSQFDPIKGELTVYEDIAPSSGADFQDFMSGNTPDTSTPQDNLDPETGSNDNTVPPINQEPLTGTVKVKVVTCFPPGCD